MGASGFKYHFFMVASLFVALLLSVAPIPDFLKDARPLWLALVLVFWVFESSPNFKMLLAWVMGLAQDVLYGTLFGLHALFLLFVVFATLRFQQRLKMFPLWQQVIFLMAIFSLGQFFVFWVNEFTGTHAQLSGYILPALISSLFWPWLYMLMSWLQKWALS